MLLRVSLSTQRSPSHMIQKIMRKKRTAVQECTSTCGGLPGVLQTVRRRTVHCCSRHADCVFQSRMTLGTKIFHQRECNISRNMKRLMQTFVWRTNHSVAAASRFAQSGVGGILIFKPQVPSKAQRLPEHLTILYLFRQNWLQLNRVHAFKVMILNVLTSTFHCMTPPAPQLANEQTSWKREVSIFLYNFSKHTM